MATWRLKGREAALWCSFGAAAAAACSIAVSQSLLGITLALLLVLRQRVTLPRFTWPLGIFVLWTLLSLAASESPAAGWPQIRKLYVLLILVALSATFAGLRHARRLVAAWCVLGAASAAVALWQFWTKWQGAQAAGEEFYSAYVADRITGFMSHWMTFSGQMMIVFLMGGALLLWGGLERRWRAALASCLALVAVAILLGMTRGTWIGATAGALYLLWHWKRWLLLLAPLAVVLAFVAGPESLRARLTSLVQPRGETDSNMHRIVTWRTGLAMIRAHPLLGVGPEMVGRKFELYVPASVPRPLPEGFYGHLHNIYLQFAAERGLPALGALLWMFAWVLRDWLRALRAAPARARWVLHGGAAVVLGVLVTGIFEHNLGDSEILMMTLASIGVVERARDGIDVA